MAIIIDFFLKYQSEAAAKDDARALSEAMGIPVSQEWRRSNTLPNVKAWRVSQDTIVGKANPTPHNEIVHQYLAGWFVIVALTYQEPVLLNTAALQFALDREACNRGDPFIVKNNIGALIQDVGCEPIFAGSTYPVGGYD